MDQNPKNVQINFELFLDLVKFHCLDHDQDQDLRIKIANDLEKKLDSIVTRDIYTRSKTAATAEEREQARQQYLDKRGIHKDFRY